MQNNRSILLSFRPNIPTIDETATSNPAEQFQNQTLRPILKFQNDLLIAVFFAYLQKRKNVFFQLSSPKKVVYIENSIRKDLNFKHRLVGLVVGHFTLAEYAVFLENEQELSRRLTHLLVQRISDQVEMFNEK